MVSPAEPLKQKHIPILDGFRGLAILLVIAMHFAGLEIGWIGVDLFFVLSGFLITWKLHTSLAEPDYFTKFYQHRCLRILPLYFMFLCVVFFLFPIAIPSLINSSYRELLQLQGWYWTFTQNIENARHGWPDNISIVHFWSLATEMQFYLVCPFLVKFAGYNRGRMVILCLSLLCLGIAFRCTGQLYLPLDNLFRYVLLPSRIDAFVIGTLVYVLCSRYHLKQVLLVTGLVMTALLIVMYTMILPLQYDNAFTSRFGYTFFDLAWGSWIGYGISGVKKNFILQLFTNRFMRATGKYSYAMYIFHLPVWTFTKRLLEGHVDLHKPGSPLIYLLAAVVFLLVYLLSMASYYCFERYFLKLKSRGVE